MTSNNSNKHTIVTDKMNEYYTMVSNKFVKNISCKKMEKIDTENIHIPDFHEHEMMMRINYNLQQLKLIAKYYKLKISGNKSQLVTRIHGFLFLSNRVVKIQKITRGMIARKYFKMHGPGFLNKSICINATDFLTMEPLNEISFEQFFSYKDQDNFVYGFDIQSMYNLIYKSTEGIKNPYNRHTISLNIIENFRSLLRLSKILKFDILTNIKELDVSNKKAIELKVVSLFQNIDALGNYSNPKWFFDLSRQQLFKLVIELIDIWAYRAPLTFATKRAICPPNGNPFPLNTINTINTLENIDNVREKVLNILEKFVNSGIDRDSKCLGAYYVLGALTLVNVEAASSLPWLYEALN
jgi:hypothetical protein